MLPDWWNFHKIGDISFSVQGAGEQFDSIVTGATAKGAGFACLQFLLKASCRMQLMEKTSNAELPISK